MFPYFSPNSLLLGFSLSKKGLATLAGRAPELCVQALCPGLVLFLNCCSLATMANRVLLLSCPLAVLASPVSSSCPSSLFCPLLSSYPPAVVLFTLLCEGGNNNSYRLYNLFGVYAYVGQLANFYGSMENKKVQKKCRKSACMKSKHKIATFKKSKKRAKKSNNKANKKAKEQFFFEANWARFFLQFFWHFFFSLFCTFFAIFRGKCKVLTFPEPQKKWGKSGRTNSRATKKVGKSG